MKAVWYEATGPASQVLTLGDMDKPVPGPGEVLVALHASGVNPSDVKVRAGLRAGGNKMAYPRIVPHSDGAGIVEAVGPGADPALVGRRVWVWNAQWQRPFGTAAEYVALPAFQVVPLPDDVSFETGAGLGIPAMTAAHCVLSGGADLSGRTMLVSGGAGTVGFLAVQFARFLGARVVATVGNPASAERVRKAGAEQVFLYSEPDLDRKILDAVGGIDVAIEVEFGANAAMLASVINPLGRIVTYGSAASMTPQIPFYQFMFKAITIDFVLAYILTDQERRDAIALVDRILRAHALDLPIEHVFPLAQCAAAHEAVEKGKRAGAIVVAVR